MLGAGLFVGGELGLAGRVLGRVVGARDRPLDRPRLDRAVAADREEALRRGADDRGVAEAQEGGERATGWSAAAAVEREGVGARVGGDLVGQADLVALPRRQFGLRAFDVGEVLGPPPPDAEGDVTRPARRADRAAAPSAGRRSPRRRAASPPPARRSASHVRRTPGVDGTKSRSISGLFGPSTRAVGRGTRAKTWVRSRAWSTATTRLANISDASGRSELWTFGRAAVGLQLVAEVTDVAAHQPAVDADRRLRRAGPSSRASSSSKIEPCRRSSPAGVRIVVVASSTS